jgi:hypothetical protein
MSSNSAAMLRVVCVLAATSPALRIVALPTLLLLPPATAGRGFELTRFSIACGSFYQWKGSKKGNQRTGAIKGAIKRCVVCAIALNALANKRSTPSTNYARTSSVRPRRSHPSQYRVTPARTSAVCGGSVRGGLPRTSCRSAYSADSTCAAPRRSPAASDDHARSADSTLSGVSEVNIVVCARDRRPHAHRGSVARAASLASACSAFHSDSCRRRSHAISPVSQPIKSSSHTNTIAPGRTRARPALGSRRQ